MAFWTAQLAECVEENVDKRNRVGAVAVLRSIRLHVGIGGDGWTELEGVIRGKGAQQVPVRLRSGQALGYLRISCQGSVASINLVRLSLKKAAYVAVDWCSVVGNPEYARDDKVEGGGPPWHEWRWMDRVG